MKKEKELAELKAEAYKTMIEVAEEHFDIKIEKKYEPNNSAANRPKSKTKVSFERAGSFMWPAPRWE